MHESRLIHLVETDTRDLRRVLTGMPGVAGARLAGATTPATPAELWVAIAADSRKAALRKLPAAFRVTRQV
jgi:hypothetical protein